MSCPVVPNRKESAALYVLSLKEQNLLTQKTVDSVVHATEGLMENYRRRILEGVRNQLQEQDIDPSFIGDDLMKEDVFDGINTRFKLDRYARNHFSYVRGDWPMHKLECSSMCIFKENWDPSETVRLTARIIAKQKTQTEKTAAEKLLTVSEFESHLEKLDNEKRELIQSDIAALHHFYSKHLEYPDNAALLVLFAQVNCNGFTIEDEELSHLGSAVFPDVALMNHSCCPNVIVTYKGTLAEVRAVQEINAGDEIFTSYIDLLYPTDDRNDRLKDSYFFNCDCKECATKGKDKAKMEIRKMNEPPKPETIRDMVKYARNVIEEFRRAKHYKTPSELLEICELSLDKMDAVFEDTNVYMLHMMYQAMGVCLYMQDWEGALRYGEKIIKPYSKHYPAYSLNVASMWLKLGRLYIGLEKKSLGVKALKKAIAIMEVAHGKDHHYIAEIKKELEEK